MKTETLLSIARAARMRAYAPYSRFPVGAALLTEDGVVVNGANIENASYGLTTCAEQVAIYTAVNAGYRKFKKIAIAADCSPPPTPCGSCRQILWELGGNLEVVMGNLGKQVISKTLLDLLPEPFGAEKWDANPAVIKITDSTGIWRLPVYFQPVGYINSTYADPGSIPKNYKELLSQVVIDPELEEGLYRLEEEKRISIISYLHLAYGYTLKEKRRGRDNEVYGVFSCRAPFRPNSIAQTTVELVERKQNILTVRGADLVNRTPVLDLKTVLPNR